VDYPFSIAAADFNGDGKLDLVVGSTEILLGNGDGTFPRSFYVGLPHFPHFMNDYGPYTAAGDFNGDSKMDLVFANKCCGTVSVLLGNGDGPSLG